MARSNPASRITDGCWSSHAQISRSSRVASVRNASMKAVLSLDVSPRPSSVRRRSSFPSVVSARIRLVSAPPPMNTSPASVRRAPSRMATDGRATVPLLAPTSTTVPNRGASGGSRSSRIASKPTLQIPVARSTSRASVRPARSGAVVRSMVARGPAGPTGDATGGPLRSTVNPRWSIVVTSHCSGGLYLARLPRTTTSVSSLVTFGALGVSRMPSVARRRGMGAAVGGRPSSVSRTAITHVQRSTRSGSTMVSTGWRLTSSSGKGRHSSTGPASVVRRILIRSRSRPSTLNPRGASGTPCSVGSDALQLGQVEVGGGSVGPDRGCPGVRVTQPVAMSGIATDAKAIAAMRPRSRIRFTATPSSRGCR